jgi:acetyl-CoA carboxylase beta subunit
MDKINSYKKGLTYIVQIEIDELDDNPIALAVMDFYFIGGSMGSIVDF